MSDVDREEPEPDGEEHVRRGPEGALLLEQDGGLVPESAEGGVPAEQPDDQGEAVLLAQPVEQREEEPDEQAPDEVGRERAQGDQGDGAVLGGRALRGVGVVLDGERGEEPEDRTRAAAEEDDEELDEQGTAPRGWGDRTGKSTVMVRGRGRAGAGR